MAMAGFNPRTALGGYFGAQEADQAQQLGQLQQASVLQGVLAKQQQMAQEQAVRGVLAQSGGDPNKAMEALIKTGNVAGAHQLAPIAKLFDERKQREDTLAGLKAIYGGGQPPADAVPAPEGTPAQAADPKAVRLDQLKKMSLLYAHNPVVMQRLQAEMDKLSVPDAAPKMRTRISGDREVQEEFDNKTQTWKQIGEGPRFARQVAPVVSVNTQNQGVLDPVKDKDALRDLAIQSLYDPGSLAGFRRDTKTMGAIQRERVALMRETGVTSEDVVSGRAGFKADTASLNKITPQYDAITAFEKTAIRNGKILVDLADKVDTTGVPVAERWIRAGRKAIAGDPDVAKFDAQINLYRAEAARILTQPNLSGVLTDTARKEMEDVIRNSASASQIKGVVNLLERDFHNRKETLEEQIAAIRARMRGRVAPGGGENPTTAPAATQPPASGGVLTPAEQAELDALRKRFGKK